MSSNKPVESVSQVAQNHILFAAVVLPIARMIYSGRIDPETVTLDGFFQALRSLGRANGEAFEILISRVEDEMRLVTHCLAAGEPKSGVVLLFTLMEGEVNALIRTLLRVRSFSSGTITDALRGTDFDTKLDVLLPLLGASIPKRLRNEALQCKSVRNLVVHNKASPALISEYGDRKSDSEIAHERAEKFFSENPIKRLEADITGFFDTALSEDTSIQRARHLFERFYERKGD